MSSSLLSNFHIAFAVAPSDTANLQTPANMLYVGTGGDLNITLSGDGQTPVILKNLSNGTFFDASVVRVSNTNTTASDIVAFV
jgi:hypothetical protein